MNRGLRILSAVVLLVLLQGCMFAVVRTTRHLYGEYVKQSKEVGAALERYRTLVLHMKADELAGMYEARGELLQDAQVPIVGRDAILSYLNSREAPTVTAYDLAATSTTLLNGGATQTGTWRQTVVTARGVTATMHGVFEAQWAHLPGGEWLIARMRTESVTPGR